jgi:hypothetical protein
MFEVLATLLSKDCPGPKTVAIIDERNAASDSKKQEGYITGFFGRTHPCLDKSYLFK